MSVETVTQLGQGYYFEDFSLGRKFRSNARTIQDADVCNFINVTHMNEVLFTDMEYVKAESAIKGRVVPAALTYCFAEGLVMADSVQRTGASRFSTWKWTSRHLRLRATPSMLKWRSSRRGWTKSRPDRGLVRTRNEVPAGTTERCCFDLHAAANAQGAWRRVTVAIPHSRAYFAKRKAPCERRGRHIRA